MMIVKEIYQADKSNEVNNNVLFISYIKMYVKVYASVVAVRWKVALITSKLSVKILSAHQNNIIILFIIQWNNFPAFNKWPVLQFFSISRKINLYLNCF